MVTLPVPRRGPALVWSLCIAATLLGGCEQPTQERAPVVRPVKAMKVGDPAELGGRRFPGKAKATREVNLAFDVSGTLNARPVNVGDRVEEGQLIASLDPRDYKSNLSAALAELESARANFGRAKELLKNNYISKAEYDGLKAAERVAAAEVQKARKAVADTRLAAPFSGRISELYVENFQSVQPKQQVARLVDTSKIEMTVDVPETLISLVPYARDIQVTFDAFPATAIPAGIKEVGAEASQTTRTYPVTLVMEQPKDVTILPGMAGYATARPAEDAPVQPKKRGLRVPLAAVYSPMDDGKRYVWVIDEATGKINRREVGVGRLTSTGLTITKGLQPGEWIATAGAHSLREGQEVRILRGQRD